MAAEQKIIQDLDKAFAGLTVTLETLQKVLAQNKAAQQEQIQYIESLKKAIGDSKEWRAFADATAKVTDAQKALTQQQKDALDIAKKEEQLKQQQIRTLEAARKAQEAQTKAQNKANQQSQAANSAYKQESDRLRELTQRAKDAAVQYGINSKEARKLRDEQQKLDRKIKDIDGSLGIHNRNVGNYGSALGKVTGFLGGFGLAMSTFLYHGFMKSVPASLEEAAIIDGASVFQVYFKIVMPLVKPTTVTVIILNAMWVWNDYLLPFLVLGDSENKTLTLALYYAKMKDGPYSVPWDLMFPAVLITVIPVIILFLFLQKQIIKGMADGAVK